MNPPDEADQRRFSVEDCKVNEPFDAVSQAIRENIEKFKEEYKEEIKAELDEDEEIPLKKTKRKRLDDFAKKPHMAFCQKANMPLYSNRLRSCKRNGTNSG